MPPYNAQRRVYVNIASATKIRPYSYTSSAKKINGTSTGSHFREECVRLWLMFSPFMTFALTRLLIQVLIAYACLHANEL